jgi:hypothetical protein
MSIILANALKDKDYNPYCMRCPGLVRMTKRTHLHWTCPCGAEHDERVQALSDLPADTTFRFRDWIPGLWRRVAGDAPEGLPVKNLTTDQLDFADPQSVVVPQ